MTHPIRRRHPRRFRPRHIGQYFLRGILVIAPVLITASALIWLFGKLDSWLHPLVTLPGAGLVTMLLFVMLVSGCALALTLDYMFGPFLQRPASSRVPASGTNAGSGGTEGSSNFEMPEWVKSVKEKVGL